MIRLQIVSLALSLGLLLFVLEMVRRRRLLERYSLPWLAGAAALVVLSASPRLIDRLAPMLGVAYPPTVLFLGGLFLLVLVALHFSLIVTKLTEQNRVLAQRLARLEAERRGPDG
ncbi:MAG: DUF2304 domain-containing protein [Deferrisomatales bacterium]